MTKNAAAKKAAREYARANGMSYTAARRRLEGGDTRENSRGRVGQVWATFEFVGDGAPAPFRLDVTPWMSRLGRYELELMRHEQWVYDPNSGSNIELPDFLALAAGAGAGSAVRRGEEVSEVEAARVWVRERTRRSELSYVVPDPGSFAGQREIFEEDVVYPYRVVFDAVAARAWVRENRRVEHFELSDLVTPALRWEWMAWHYPGDIDCAAGRHFWDGSPSPYSGECFGCGALMVGKNTWDGDEYEAVVDEAEFFEDVVSWEAAWNWAPPLSLLETDFGGITQRQWHERARRAHQDWTF